MNVYISHRLDLEKEEKNEWRSSFVKEGLHTFTRISALTTSFTLHFLLKMH